LIALLGQLEKTLHQGFIRSGNLRRWLAGPTRTTLVQSLKALFDDIYVHQVEDHPMAVPMMHAPEDDDAEDALINPLANPTPARIRYQGVVLSCAKTHPGNSQIMYSVKSGIHDASIAPAIIQRIQCSILEGVTMDIAPVLPSSRSGRDPFSQWPELGAECWSMATGPMVTIQLSDVVSQFISCKLGDSTPDQVIMMVSNVCLFLFVMTISSIKPAVLIRESALCIIYFAFDDIAI
jgi:hypothetical protein